MPKEVLRQLTQAKPDIQDADLLLFRGKGVISRFIRSFGRGKYSHVAKASWLKGELFCLEVREWKGGRAVTLSSQVQKFPGQIDVYETNALHLPGYDRAKSDSLMLLFAGIEYGYLDIMETAALHTWGLRILATANVDDDFVSKRPPYCSAACAIADRVGGGDRPSAQPGRQDHGAKRLSAKSAIPLSIHADTGRTDAGNRKRAGAKRGSRANVGSCAVCVGDGGSCREEQR